MLTKSLNQWTNVSILAMVIKDGEAIIQPRSIN